MPHDRALPRRQQLRAEVVERVQGAVRAHREAAAAALLHHSKERRAAPVGHDLALAHFEAVVEIFARELRRPADEDAAPRKSEGSTLSRLPTPSASTIRRTPARAAVRRRRVASSKEKWVHRKCRRLSDHDDEVGANQFELNFARETRSRFEPVAPATGFAHYSMTDAYDFEAPQHADLTKVELTEMSPTTQSWFGARVAPCATPSRARSILTPSPASRARSEASEGREQPAAQVCVAAERRRRRRGRRDAAGGRSPRRPRRPASASPPPPPPPPAAPPPTAAAAAVALVNALAAPAPKSTQSRACRRWRASRRQRRGRRRPTRGRRRRRRARGGFTVSAPPTPRRRRARRASCASKTTKSLLAKKERSPCGRRRRGEAGAEGARAVDDEARARRRR